MMEKLKYTKFKTLLISSFICIVFITTIFFGVYAAKPGQDEPKNIVETDINLSDEPEVSPGTGDSMQNLKKLLLKMLRKKMFNRPVLLRK